MTSSALSVGAFNVKGRQDREPHPTAQEVSNEDNGYLLGIRSDKNSGEPLCEPRLAKQRLKEKISRCKYPSLVLSKALVRSPHRRMGLEVMNH